MPQFFPGYQSPDDLIAEQTIKRRAAEAAALRQRSMTAPEAVGGIPVVPNTAGLALRGIAGVLGARETQGADQQAYDYAQQRRQRLVAAMQGMGQAKTPDDLQALGERLMPEDPNAGLQLMRQAQELRRQQGQADLLDQRFQQQQAAQQQNWDRNFQAQEAARQEQARRDAQQHADQMEILRARLAAQGAGGAGDMTSEVANINYILKGVDKAGHVIDPDLPNETPEQAQMRRQNMLTLVKRAPQFYQAATGPQQFPQAPGLPATPVLGPDGRPAQVAAPYDPTLQHSLAAQKAAGTVEGRATAEATAGEPGRNASAAATKLTLQQLKTSPGFTAIYGSIAGITPSVRKESVDAEALRNQVVGMLALENRGKMKGTGAISDFETRLLNQASSTLSNPRISPEAAAAEIDKVTMLIDLWNQGASDEAVKAAFAGAPTGAASLQPSAPAANAPPPGIDPEDWKYMTPEEQAELLK